MAPPEGKCIVCQTSTTKQCTRCNEGLDVDGIASPTYYCSKKCEGADRTSHKDACLKANNRKLLYRASSLLLETFYVFRRAGYDVDTMNVVIDDETIHCYEPLICRRKYSQSPLYQFPDASFTDEKDKKALLSYGTCQLVLDLFHNLIKSLLTGLTSPDTPPQELRIQMKCPLRVQHHRRHDNIDVEAPKEYEHDVLKVTINGDETFIMDLAGAEYGQLQPLLPLKGYVHDYVEDVSMKMKFGWEKERADVLNSGANHRLISKAYDPRGYMAQRRLVAVINEVVDIWALGSSKSLTGLLKTTDASFKNEKARFIKTLESSIRHYTQQWKAQGVWYTLPNGSTNPAEIDYYCEVDRNVEDVIAWNKSKGWKLKGDRRNNASTSYGTTAARGKIKVSSSDQPEHPHKAKDQAQKDLTIMEDILTMKLTNTDQETSKEAKDVKKGASKKPKDEDEKHTVYLQANPSPERPLDRSDPFFSRFGRVIQIFENGSVESWTPGHPNTRR